MWYQTDFDGFIKKHGCLGFSIYQGIVKRLRSKGYSVNHLNKVEMEYMFERAHNEGTIQRGRNDSRFGLYVTDHEKYGNVVLRSLGFPELRFKYLAAEYMPGEERKSWGSVEISDPIIILQIWTGNWGGHFILMDYDPYQPSPGVAFIRSARYYDVVEDKG